MIYTFQDFHQNTVQLSFDKMPFSSSPKHVWVICRYHNQWLLTKHQTRGLEFPGGKVELGETPEEAAEREVLEETGGIVQKLTYMAQYCVSAKSDTIIKNVYYADVDALTAYYKDYETFGPVCKQVLPENLQTDKRYSFIMKDKVLYYCLRNVDQTKKLPKV